MKKFSKQEQVLSGWNSIFYFLNTIFLLFSNLQIYYFSGIE